VWYLTAGAKKDGAGLMAAENDFQMMRQQMIETQLRARGIDNPRVLMAMASVPRHEFVSTELRHLAYRDSPLPIGDDQTISQPYMVAFMTQLLHLSGHERVLEIGTGSGYQTAVLCTLANQVYTLERHPRLADRASRTLSRLGYDNVEIHIGDGSQGLPDMAPFDAILVTAAAPALPGPLRSQMSPDGGRMVIPLGDKRNQYLELVKRWENRWELEQLFRVRFVPLFGRYGFRVYSHEENDSSAPASV
jgi:protein-L-isoaspartate(D-aspartate) O-methyltransferase